MAKGLNMNDFAREVTLQEGGKVSLPIGQVKEVIRLTMKKLAAVSEDTAKATIKKYNK